MEKNEKNLRHYEDGRRDGPDEVISEIASHRALFAGADAPVLIAGNFDVALR